MWPDIGEFVDFYQTERGHAVRQVIRRRIRSLWPELKGKSLIGIGYTVPFLAQFKNETSLLSALFPAPLGAMLWPEEAPRKTLIAEEDEWPLPDSSIDRLLLVHCLEFAGNTENLLREAWRVLTPGGKALVIVPRRRSLWAQSERTPFGYGQPFSPQQLQNLFTRQSFRARRLMRGLYLPLWWPSPSLRTALNIERHGMRWAKGMGGLLFLEVEKELYGMVPLRRNVKRPRLALPSLPLKPA